MALSLWSMVLLKEVGCQGRSHMQRNPSLDLLFLASSWKAGIRDTVYAGFSFSSHTCVVWICLKSADRQGLGYACCFSTTFLGDVSLLSSANERVPKGMEVRVAFQRDFGRKNLPRTTPPPFCLQHIVWSTSICSVAAGSMFSVFTKFRTI